MSFVDQPSGEIEERSTDPSSAEGRDFSGFADISDEAYTAQPQVGSSSQGPSPSPMKILKWKHWTPHMLLVAITREYEREEPCPPERFCGLESYQKQSLAFMIDVEKSRSVSGVGLACRTCDWSKKRYTENVRGGWLADDVGMDNRAVCIALVVANRSNAKQVGPEQWTHWCSLAPPSSNTKCTPGVGNLLCSPSNPAERPDDIRIRGTLVIAHPALLVQWMDEIKTFSPSIKVGMLYGDHAKHTICKLFELDVILASTSNCVETLAKHCIGALRFHRILIDEAHSISKNVAAKLRTLRADFVWGVTGTPLMSGVSDLFPIASLLGHFYAGMTLCHIAECSSELGKKTLRSLMIRHTKDQLIGGHLALPLLPLCRKTILLEMTTLERRVYLDLCSVESMKKKKRSVDFTTTEVERTFKMSLSMCANNYTGVKSRSDEGVELAQIASCPTATLPLCHTGAFGKLKALHTDLCSLRADCPSARVVVFTQYEPVRSLIEKMLVADNFLVSSFTQRTSIAQRHILIRAFQATTLSQATRHEMPMSVFVVLSGASSIPTLTAANRVYLMEPMLNPLSEAEVEGRVHGLGQLNCVTVVRFAYHDSIESRIINLQEEIKRGEIGIRNGTFPNTAIQLLLHHRVETIV